jgi:hypothetical protein
MTISFECQDREYEEWCKENEGYVFNFFGGTDRNVDMNKIHHVNCRYLGERRTKAREPRLIRKYAQRILKNFSHLLKKRGAVRLVIVGVACESH